MHEVMYVEHAFIDLNTKEIAREMLEIFRAFDMKIKSDVVLL